MREGLINDPYDSAGSTTRDFFGSDHCRSGIKRTSIPPLDSKSLSFFLPWCWKWLFFLGQVVPMIPFIVKNACWINSWKKKREKAGAFDLLRRPREPDWDKLAFFFLFSLFLCTSYTLFNCNEKQARLPFVKKKTCKQAKYCFRLKVWSKVKEKCANIHTV
jgi:hypothetical protein